MIEFLKQKINLRDGFSILQLKTVRLKKVSGAVWYLPCIALGLREIKGADTARGLALGLGRLGH